MRKNTFFGKLFSEFVPVFLVIALYSVNAAGAAIDDSLKDDVTAMITSAKKMPHQIFIIDSSESMNSFAYSDYVDTCRDSIINLSKALDLCENFYQQCRNIESNASCAVDLNCGDISSKCSSLRSRKTNLTEQCRQITTDRYPEPGMFDVASSIDDDNAKRYIGPWNPTKTYKEDLCFYNWTADSNADVIEATKAYDAEVERAKAAAATNGTNYMDEMNYDNLYKSTADAYNKQQLCQQWNKTGTACDDKFNQFLSDNGGYIAERSDWDCITDGSGKILPADVSNPSTTYYLGQTGGVSGLWLNWKYASSLDALKIVLADTHQFSFQPRFRGKNECYKTDFIPQAIYKEAVLDENGSPVTCTADDIENHTSASTDNCVEGSLGSPKFENKKMCFIAFEPSLSNVVPDTKRVAQLESLKSAMDSTWKLEPKAMPDSSESANDTNDPKRVMATFCTDFKIDEDFSIYDGNSISGHTGSSLGKGCDKCMKRVVNADNTVSFIEIGCTSYNGSAITSDVSNLPLGTVEVELSKKCCKSYNCTNPKCRDNDLCCKDNAAAFPNSGVEGYDICRPIQNGVPGEYSCELSYYSEYDQDKNHCCADLNCAEEGTVTTNSDGCQQCESGSVMGEDVKETLIQPQVILPNPGENAYCGAGSTEDECKDIAITVGINADDLATIDFSDVSNIKIDVYYDCADSTDAHPSHLLGTGTCNSAATCASVVSGELTGCSDKGYRMEAGVTVTRHNCKFSTLDLSLTVEYSFDEGYMKGKQQEKTVFDPDTPFYHVYTMQASASTEKVYEYECRAAFYTRETNTVEGNKCPTDSSDIIDLINLGREGDPVDYCEAGSFIQETVSVDMWGNATSVACSWLCRTTVQYEEPWKCASFFYMMDDLDRHGPNVCNDECRNAMNDNTKLETCCSCIDAHQAEFRHQEEPKEVTMASGTYKCTVSGYQYAEISDGYRATVSGYQAEIVNGHITEGAEGEEGYYNLSPYHNEDGTLWSPYLTFAAGVDMDDTSKTGWYSGKSLIHSEQGRRYLGSALTSLFTTNDPADRKNVCIYDLVWGWSGEDCNSCGTGCCAVDISQDSNNCDYPQFWMRIPDGSGGRYLSGPLNLSNDDEIKEFRKEIRQLKAIGGTTLGETLYDAWRYLGGMYALYDENYKDTPYVSPFAANDPQCFTNEAVIISGGQPQFDDNYTLKKDYGVNCPDYVKPTAGGGDEPPDTVKPCVNANLDAAISQHSPYLVDEWEKNSLMNVAKFVNRNTFWGAEECRSAPISVNADGFFGKSYQGTACNGNNPQGDISSNIPLIDRVHSIAIGEWGLSAMYGAMTGNAAGAFDVSLIEKTAKYTKRDGEPGRYYGLSASGNASSQIAGGGGTFTDLTTLFSSFVNQSRPTDVVVGRPHWTSSLVQPFDVEEKYRGPEAYVAGAVPVDGSVSRFWFGNLKKYNVDGGDCPITNDEDADCGEWKKQTFDANDCFASDAGVGFDGDDDKSVEQYQKLMLGGAAYKLKTRLEGSSCGTLPCFTNSPRTIYYDLGQGSMQQLTSAVTDDSALLLKFRAAIGDSTMTADKLNRILDYMAGYDAFKTDDTARKRVRYSQGTGEETFEVDDPFNIDFNHTTKLTLRPLLLGAIIHSKPIAVYYGDTSETRIYVGANDGMLHAFDHNGVEKYAYIPSLAFKSIANFANPNTDIFFNATVDGPISMLHIDQSHDGIINNGEKAFLIFGYRRGGNGYTVIDISDPNAPGFVQNLNEDGGLSFGKAAVFRKCSGTCSYANNLEYYLAVPGGYDALCHDPLALTTAMQDNIPSGSACNSLSGNMFRIYKFDKSQYKFTSSVEFSTSESSNPIKTGTTDQKEWLVTSFTSVPFIVNTDGKAAVNTEFVYFTDLSGTVFRVDVTSNKMADWTAKVVFAERSAARVDNVWRQIGRSYVASNFFPPLERYNPARASSDDSGDWLIPIPVVTGNAANPRFKKQEGIFVFYDKKNGDNTPLYTTDFLVNGKGNSHSQINTMIEDKRGWQVNFDKDNGEKGITEPLIVYDIYGSKDAATSNSYSIAWNTYIPMKATECKTFGTSSNYERYVPDGAQAFKDTSLTGNNGEWSVSQDTSGKCISDSSSISLATGVGIIATDEGFDLTFGAGADIFRKEQLTVKRNSTYIIKWYELY